MAERGVRVAARLDARGFEASVDLPAGAVTAIVGPNGAGKSTLLGLVSGLLTPSSGTVTIDGRPVAGPGRALPAHRRPVAMLEQRPLLFPHLDVLDNVAFGVRARGASTSTARERARRELDAVDAARFAGRHASELSGGEAQRVALARALATDPTVVLLDEPFAALDVPAAVAMRQLLSARLSRADGSGAAVVLVTHDPLDVWALADRLVALESGRLSAQGDVASLLGRPPTRFLAELSGVNLLHGTAAGDAGGLVVRAADVAITGLWETARPAVAGHQALATFAPASVALFGDEPHGSPRNTWRVRVTGLDPRGATVRVHLELADGQPLAADLTAQGVAALGLRPGAAAVAQVKATQVTLYPR